MPLKDILFATSTSAEIEALAREQLKKLPKSPFELKVKDIKNSASSLHITVFAIKKGGLLHGRTEYGDHVFIKLGELAERVTRRPSVILYRGKESTKTSLAHEKD